MSIPVMLYVDDYSEDSVDSTTSDWEESDDEDDNPVINFIIEKEILELFLVYDQHYSKFIRIDGKCDPNSNNLIKLINDSVEVNKQFLKWICMRYDRGYYHPRSRDDNQSSSEDESSPLSEDDQQVVQETTITSTAPTDVSTTAVIKTSTDTSDSPNSNIWTTKDIIYKLYNLLLLLIRDWSADGISQRECYIPFLKSLKRLYPDEKSRNKIKIVCPGGGMGRLAYEIAKLGFETVQNEMSMFLIVALKSIFIKDEPLEINTLSFKPFIHSNNTLSDTQSIMKEIKIPDVKIDMNGINLQFEHGNFFRKFKVPSSLDCICTSFFVDVVPDIVHLVKYCKMLLKPSGIWINNGPLYYHNTSKNALHLTDDQLLLLLEEDFTILEHSLNSYKYTKIDSVNSVEFNRCLWFVVTPKNINNV